MSFLHHFLIEYHEKFDSVQDIHFEDVWNNGFRASCINSLVKWVRCNSNMFTWKHMHRYFYHLPGEYSDI